MNGLKSDAFILRGFNTPCGFSAAWVLFFNIKLEAKKPLQILVKSLREMFQDITSSLNIELMQSSIIDFYNMILSIFHFSILSNTV